MTSSNPDISAILNQVKALETDKNSLETERSKNETERTRLLTELAEARAKMGRLTEGKRQEMQQSFDTVIKKWLSESVEDAKVREEFEQGVNRLVEKTEEDSGIWRVVMCASNLHARRMAEIEALKGECETLKSRGVGDFRDEASRKRVRDDTKEQEHTGGDVWAEFEASMKGKTFDPAL
jgi:hypothetical protein